jgi:hypothetical protein
VAQSLKPMEGTKHGVTFACVNTAKRLAATDTADTKEGDGTGGEMVASTWAVRFYEKGKEDKQVADFFAQTGECMDDAAHASDATNGV